MINLRTLVLSSALLFPCLACAQSNTLEPAEGYFSSYDFSHKYRTKVRNILLKGITDTPDAMLVTLSSFSPESAIVLSKGEVILLKCSKPIWNNDAPEKIKIEKKSIRISKELGDAVHKLWFDALGTTSYPNESRDGLDGVSYYFTSFRVGLGVRAGTAWTPEAKSLPSELLRVAYELSNLGNGGTTSEKKLLSEVKALHGKIAKREQGGAEQPATALQSKSKASKNSKLESKVRSQ